MDKLAVYIHWPYCARICPYCDFNVYKGAQNAALVEAILKDLDHWRTQSGPRLITSIHFGGGTPSLLSATDIGRLIDRVDRLWGLPDDAEVGLEANPQDQDSQRWEDYKAVGINRVSLGVQTFNDAALKRLGRDHDGEGGQKAVALAREIFGNISLDLIFGWAEQTAADLNRDLNLALNLNPAHLSAYQLTIEPGTAFAKAQARGQERAVDNDKSALFYDLIETRLEGQGYDHYEVSNYAQPGFESRHNKAYWLAQDYVGVGPGAHGRITLEGRKHARAAADRPVDYIASVLVSGTGMAENEILSPEDRAAEYVLMGLRVKDGISLQTYKAITGEDFSSDRYEGLVTEGYLHLTGDRLSATKNGWLVLDHLTRTLLG